MKNNFSGGKDCCVKTKSRPPEGGTAQLKPMRKVYFFQSFSISSNVFPLVSGTNFHMKTADKIPIIP